LAWLGFGSLGNGLWISPHDVERQIEELSAQLGIEEHLECFRAERVAGAPISDLVARCWDLEAVDRDYRAFVARWAPELQRVQAASSVDELSDEECYTLRFDLIHEFRVFPLEDPYLPRPLLPESWAGEEATELFRALHDRLAGPADRHVDRVLEDAPVAVGAAEGP